MVGGLILAYVDRLLVPASVTDWDFSDVFGDVVNMAIPVMGFVLASRRPGNRIGWLALAAGLTLGLRSFADQYEQHALVAAPGSLPAGALALWVSEWIWLISLALVAFLFLLFPTGRLRSRRWRPGRVVRGRCFRAEHGSGDGRCYPRVGGPVRLPQPMGEPAGAGRDGHLPLGRAGGQRFGDSGEIRPVGG